MRDAIQHCKNVLQIDPAVQSDVQMIDEDKVNMEKCLTKDFLGRFGEDYFGKRDLIYIDPFGTSDVEGKMQSKYM